MTTNVTTNARNAGALDDEVGFDPLDHAVELAQVVERGVELAVGFEREFDDAARTAQSFVTLADGVDDVLSLCDFVRMELDE